MIYRTDGYSRHTCITMGWQCLLLLNVSHVTTKGTYTVVLLVAITKHIFPVNLA